MRRELHRHSRDLKGYSERGNVEDFLHRKNKGNYLIELKNVLLSRIYANIPTF